MGLVVASRRLGQTFKDRGSAALEFIAGALVLIVPCVYAVLCFGAIEATTFALESAARNAARVYVDQHSPERARAVAQRAVDDAMSMSADLVGRPRVSIGCLSSCDAPGALVTVRVSARVALPLVPQWPAVRSFTSIAVSAVASQSTARFGVAQ